MELTAETQTRLGGHSANGHEQWEGAGRPDRHWPNDPDQHIK
jgi:hypothetical protein